jgi:hypothetical protein
MYFNQVRCLLSWLNQISVRSYCRKCHESNFKNIREKHSKLSEKLEKSFNNIVFFYKHYFKNHTTAQKIPIQTLSFH